MQPVRPEPGDDALLPPGGRPDLALPGPRGVPVVADVVVVEDHRRRHGRQHPADDLLAPGQPVQLGVLDEVLDLQARRLVEAAPSGHELLEALVRGRVGIDLVAQQQQDVGPRRRGVVAQGERERAQRIDPVGPVALGIVRAGGAAGAEREVGQAAGAERADAAGRHPGSRPDELVADAHRIGVVAAGQQAVEHDQRVVGPVHRHRAGAPGATGPLHRDPGSHRRAHPHRRGGVVDVAQHRAEDERLVDRGEGHGVILPSARGPVAAGTTSRAASGPLRRRALPWRAWHPATAVPTGRSSRRSGRGWPGSTPSPRCCRRTTAPSCGPASRTTSPTSRAPPGRTTPGPPSGPSPTSGRPRRWLPRRAATPWPRPSRSVRTPLTTPRPDHRGWRSRPWRCSRHPWCWRWCPQPRRSPRCRGSWAP